MVKAILIAAALALGMTAANAQLWERDRLQRQLSDTQRSLETQSLERQIDARARDRTLRQRIQILRLERQIETNRLSRPPSFNDR